MFAYALAFNPRSKATNIGWLLSLGAVFWLEEELLLSVGEIWGIVGRNGFHLAENPILYICGLGVSVGCERLSEHSTRCDENHKYRG